MRVKRIIEKEVTNCQDCPYYYEDHEMGATLTCCKLKGGNGYDAILSDIISWKRTGISKNCPLNNA